VSVRIQMRRGTTSEWNTADPILNEGEIGYNSTLTSFKIGDGESLWSELDYYQAAADITPNEIGAIASTEKNAADGVAGLDASKNVITALSVVFEGATADAYETLLTVTEPASDITLSLPNTSDTLVGRATTDTLTNKTLTSPVVGTSLTTASTSFDLLNTTATTVNFAGAASTLSIGAVTSTTTINDSLVVTGNLTVNGTTTTIDTQTLQVEDKNIILGYGSTSDVAVDGGGITLTGATNKTFNWVDATDAWTSSEHMNLLTGKSYKINGTSISAALPSLTWGEVKNGKSGLVIS
jgi:hypothetical protein